MDVLHHSPERKLWISVLLECIENAATPVPKRGLSRNGLNCSEVWSAREWARRGGKDFQMVCAFAGVEYTVVRDWARRMDAAGWPPNEVEKARLALAALAGIELQKDEGEGDEVNEPSD